MFRLSSEEQYGESSQSGVRHLFSLGPFVFQDALDEEERLHHFLLAGAADEGETAVYEVDRDTMYEFMARFLAGEFEKQEYEMDRSPGHDALLDLLEIASARARAGESDFTVGEMDDAIDEVLDEDAEAGGFDDAADPGGADGGDGDGEARES